MEHGAVSENESLQTEQRAAVAQSYLEKFAGLKPEEKVIIIWDEKADPKTKDILSKAAQKVTGQKPDIYEVTKDTSHDDVMEKVSGHQVILNLNMNDKSDLDLYDTDVLKNMGARSLVLLDSPASVFNKDGMMDEDPEAVEMRLSRMEAALQNAHGIEITTSYGTNLQMTLKHGERRWASVMGKILEPGMWDNAGAEVFTTPDEFEVNGVLMIPLLDTEISSRQGVDEYIRVEITSGMITDISGGKSADQMRRKLESDAQKEAKAGRDPKGTYRIAEIGIGASRGVPLVSDETKSWRRKGIATAFTEKAWGSVHVAFGESDHGEEGTNGVYNEQETHYDFVLSGSGGLKMVKYDSEENLRLRKNGQDLFHDGKPTALLMGM